MFLETIKYENGQWFNLDFHQQRLDHCRREQLGRTDQLFLAEALEQKILPPSGLFKVRVKYDKMIQDVTWESYIRKYPKSLKLVYDDTIDYAFKYQDRTNLTALFAQRGDCDDILIVKNGRLTDTYYANIALFDGERWLTPAYPLLAGTQRAYLLYTKQIHASDIFVQDLPNFKKLLLLNAFMDFEAAVEINIANIHF